MEKEDYEVTRDLVTDGLVRLAEGLTDEELKENVDKIKIVLGEAYEMVISILRKYLDLREEYYPLITTWIIGTYLHSSFDTYPYLFMNAMRGSGKTKVLKLISALANRGELISSLREAVLFRDCKDKTICVDEFESIMSKENQALRELLNAAYKKGNKVKRLKKVRKTDGEDYEIESFELYTPICMANIWGMEEVLLDRCITVILEKSSNPTILRLIEDFDKLDEIKWVKKVFLNNLVQLCSYFGVGGVKKKWNCFIIKKYTQTTLTPPTAFTSLEKNQPSLTHSDLEMFNKIHDTEINGRNLELWLPLLLTSKMIGETVFDNILGVAAKLTKETKKEEMTESRDVSVFDFVSRNLCNEYISIKDLTHSFRDFIGEGDNEERWVNDKWLGRALKRLSLVLDKRRVARGIEVRLNISKAIEKMVLFRQEEQK